MKSNYFVVLKENQSFSVEIADKIKKMELFTPKERFPFEELIEVYFNASEGECLRFINKLDDDLKPLFLIKRRLIS
ncbi:hypothetical protein [Sulfurimonas sp. CS5]|uniref:hypothetical protein n=1 Tax=Sulfurimonas sp. CS5 TaxID=3391145 RepID=UPI0039EAE213